MTIRQDPTGWKDERPERARLIAGRMLNLTIWYVVVYGRPDAVRLHVERDLIAFGHLLRGLADDPLQRMAAVERACGANLRGRLGFFGVTYTSFRVDAANAGRAARYLVNEARLWLDETPAPALLT